jgi:hypothetical protein
MNRRQDQERERERHVHQQPRVQPQMQAALHQKLSPLFGDLFQVAQHVVGGYRHDRAQVSEVRGHQFAAAQQAERRRGRRIRQERPDLLQIVGADRLARALLDFDLRRRFAFVDKHL